jgi:hypothetical protein
MYFYTTNLGKSLRARSSFCPALRLTTSPIFSRDGLVTENAPICARYIFVVRRIVRAQIVRAQIVRFRRARVRTAITFHNVTAPLSSRRESRRLQGVFLDMLLHRLVKRGPVGLVLLRNAIFKRAIELGLFQEIAKRLQDGVELGARLPGIRLQETQADVAEIIVCHIGVVDGGDKLDDRGLEGVIGGKVEEDAEFAWVIDGRGGRRQGNVPGMDSIVGRQSHGVALRGILRNFGKFLGDALGHCEGVVTSKKVKMDDVCSSFVLGNMQFIDVLLNHDADDGRWIRVQ